MFTMSNPDPSVMKPGFPNGSSSNVGPWFSGPEKKSNIHSFYWTKPGDMVHMNGAHDSASDMLSSLLERQYELNGFSSSLPALLHEKCEFLNPIKLLIMRASVVFVEIELIDFSKLV